MKTTVLLSPAWVDGQYRRHDDDVRAWEVALNAKLKPCALMACAADNDAVRDYLGLGLEQIDVLESDQVPAVLIAHLKAKKADVIVMGSKAKGQSDTGLLPYVLAKKFKMNLISSVLDCNKTKEGKLEVTQFLPKGRRRKIMTGVPVVLVVSPYAKKRLQFSFAKSELGIINILSTPNIKKSDENMFVTFAKVRGELEPFKLSKTLIEVASTKSSHARLQSRITTKGVDGMIVKDGSAKDKAKILLKYLNDNGIDLSG